MSQPRTTRIAVLLPALTVISGLIIPILTIHLGFYPWKDEEYQIMCIADYQSTPLSAFTMYLGHLWRILTGCDTILSFRWLAYICNSLSIALPCSYFYRKSRNMTDTAVIFLILQLAISLFGLFSYEWDTTTHLFLTICCLISVGYLDKPTLWRISLLAIFSACAIFSRIPNVALLPVVMILICVSRKGFRLMAADLLCYLAVLLASSAIIIMLIWGGIDNFVHAWSPENYITGHGSFTDVLFMQVWTRYPISLRYFFMWGGVFAAVCYFRLIDINRLWRYAALGVITFSIIALWLVIRVTSDDTNSYPIDIFYFSVAMIPAIAMYKHSGIRHSVLLALTLLAYALVSYVGSDCGLYKILCMPLMPIALAELLKYRSRSVKEFYVIIATAIVICYVPLRLKNPWTKEWMNRYPATYEIDKLQGLRHSDSEIKRRTYIYNLARKIESEGHRILFIGRDRYLFDYILGHSQDNVDRYPIQRYHDDNDFADIEETIYEMADRFDYLYLGYEFDESEMQKVSNKLAEKGFSLYLSDEDFIIWQK